VRAQPLTLATLALLLGICVACSNAVAPDAPKAEVYVSDAQDGRRRLLPLDPDSRANRPGTGALELSAPRWALAHGRRLYAVDWVTACLTVIDAESEAELANWTGFAANPKECERVVAVPVPTRSRPLGTSRPRNAE
jgi:hypothetical protein